MRRFGKSLVVLLVLLVAFSLAAAAQQKTTLRVSWWGSQTRHDLTLKVIELFEQLNPDIDVVPEYTGWDGYWDRLAAQAAGGNLPDVMQQDYKYLYQYYESNLLLPLDPFFESGLIDIRGVDESVLSSGRINGQHYGLSLGSNAYAILYDPEMFARAGIAAPGVDWTWEDFVDIARQIRQRLGVFAITAMPMTMANVSGFEHYLRQHGQTLFTADGTALGYDDDRYFVEFYKMDIDLTREGVLAPPEIRLENPTVENDLIVTGRAAMASYWTNQIVAISSAAGRRLEMALFPNASTQVQYGSYIKPSMFFSITQHTKNAEAAARFIDFFTNSVEANRILMAERGVPIAAGVRAGLAPFLGPEQRQMFDMVELAARYSSPIDPPPPAAFNQVLDILDDVHYKMLFGVATLEQGAREFRQRASAALAAQ